MTDADLAATQADLVHLSSEIVSAYVCRNAVPVAQLPELMATVHAALRTLGQPAPVVAEEPTKSSAAEIKRSIAPDSLTSFLDGRRYQTLKRHLSRHGLTPEAYRTRFGLPKDYPMVAPSYSARRSELAKTAGLGMMRKRKDAAVGQAGTEDRTSSPIPDVSAEPKRRGRPKAKSADVVPA